MKGANEGPSLIMIFGPAGVGKTVDTGFSFPTARFYSKRNALVPIRKVCGYTPNARPMPENLLQLHAEIAAIPPGTVDTVVVDDFSGLGEDHVDFRRASGLSGLQLWGQVRHDFLAFRSMVRDCNARVVLNCWEQDFRSASEHASEKKGGPKLPGAMNEDFPPMCDVVFRAVVDTRMKPWPGAYQCAADPRITMKDRYDIAYSISPIPMNLAEYLRMAGETVNRHPGMPWQEAAVEMIVEEALDENRAKRKKILNEWYVKLTEQFNRSQALWTVRDAQDRIILSTKTKNANASFI